MFAKYFHFGRRRSPSWLLISLAMAAGCSMAIAQSVDTVGTRDTVSVYLSNYDSQDSVFMPAFRLAVNNSATDTMVAVVFASRKFRFARSAPYNVVVQGGLAADSARIVESGDTLCIKVKGSIANGDADTLLIPKVCVVAATAVASNAGSPVDSLKFLIGNSSSYSEAPHAGDVLRLYSGSAYMATVATQPGTGIDAGSLIVPGPVLSLFDRFGNPARDTTVSIHVNAVLSSNLSSGGNGTLSGTTIITKTLTPGGSTQYAFAGLSYTKAENIRLVFSAPGADSMSDDIAINPGPPSIISYSSLPSKETIAVDDHLSYVVVVTDRFYNIVTDLNPVLVPSDNHGGSFYTSTSATHPSSTIALTAGDGTVVFRPNKYYVGPDTLTFTLKPTYNITASRTKILIGSASTVGGIIVDYAGAANGLAIPQGSASEKVAAGATVFVRAFLRDAFGNPIDVTNPSQVTFSIVGVNGVGASLHQDAMLLTQKIAEPQFTNNNRTAVGIAIPYSISTNTTVNGTQQVDSLLAASEGCSTVLTIWNRSNVPEAMKFYYTSGDSSIIVSDNSNTAALEDSSWDAYGNVVKDPGDVTIPPLRNSYRLVYSVKGLARLVHQGITTLADTLYPSEPLTTTICSGRIAGIDTVSVSPAANPGSVKWQPVYITPSSFSRIVLTPAAITDAAAGETRMLTVEKRDKYGNHIDWGLAGGEHRRVGGAYPGAIVTPSSQDSLNDLHSLVADTLSTGHNHGGTVSVGSAVGVPGAASVGGAEPYNATIAYTAAPAGIDTQMIYVSLGGNMDTSVVCSAPTGDPKKFLVSIDTTAALDHNAGDSVAIRFAPFDSTENHVYSYFSTGQTLKLDHVSFNPVADKDTTYYFTYEDIHGGWHKVDGGSAIIDTLNHERGESVVYVHVFATDDSAHTITVKEGNIGGTSPPMIFHPLDPTEPGAEGKWTVEVTGPLNPTGPFEFTIIPRDRYFNRWRATRVMTGVIVNISSNLMGEFDTGSNPKVISGPTPFTGTLSGASGNLVIYVFNNTSDRVLGKSKPIALTGQAFSFGDLDGSGDVTAFDAALILRYLVGDTTFTPAQVGAADVSGDGTVTAYDASLILRYVAGDTGVHLGTTAKGKHFPSSSISGVGSVFIGETQYGTDGALNVPVMLSGARSVHGIELVLNIGGSIDVKGVTINPPSDWLSAYRVKDGILKVAMSGATPLAPGCMANISASLLRQDANVKLTGDVVLNENAKQSLGEIKLAAMPTKFGLDQNYPNPFNPSTTIGYQLPASSEVSLKIYDVLGREVAVLVNRRQNAGVYKVEFDGSKFAGGVYFCRIVVHGNDGKSFVATKKLVLAK